MSLYPSNRVLDTVMKVAAQDEGAAVELVRFALFESLTDQIDQARPQLEYDHRDWMAARVAKARSYLLKSTVGKALDGQPEPVDLDTARGLAIIDAYVSKGIMDFFNERQHPRGQGGRFVHRSLAEGVSSSMPPAEQHDARILNASQQVKEWKDNKQIDDETPIELKYQHVDPTTGNEASAARPTTRVKSSKVKETLENHRHIHPDWKPHSIAKPSSQEVHGTGSNLGALDAHRLFTGGASSLVGRGAVSTFGADGTVKDGDDSAASWNHINSDDNTQRRSYNRMSMTGGALQNLSVPGSAGHNIGGLARLIGDLGPEAEKVLGPGIRRTAYRYRGTERSPDRLMVNQVKLSQKIADDFSTGPVESRISARKGVANTKAGKGNAPLTAIGVAEHYAGPAYRGQQWTQDRLELAMRGDTAAGIMLNQIPDSRLAEVSIEAGELPPSQGVLIDADGDVVSEAQGYNGDHYLPFDLRNLSDLHGGQYVRTRAAGGLTTEDLYTGLLTGARQVQVVSNSGVFTLEFDPSIRGGRRYTDKALRMIGRYGKLLQAIEGKDGQGSNLYEHDVDPNEKHKMMLAAYEDADWDPVAGEAEFKARLAETRLKGRINMASDEDIYRQATEQSNAQAGRARDYNPHSQSALKEIDELAHKLKGEGNASLVRQRVLDGTGYATALATLKQEFPFFIRDVRYETVPDFADTRGIPVPKDLLAHAHARDRGRVRTGETNAEASMSRNDRRRVAKPARAEVATPRSSNVAGSAQSDAPSPAEPSNRVGGELDAISEGRVHVKRVKDTKPLTELAKEPETVRKLATDLSVTTKMFDELARALVIDNSKLPNPDDQSPEGAFSTGGMLYARAVEQKEGSSTKLAEWLLTKATDKERTKFLEGFKEAGENLPRLGLQSEIDNRLEPTHGKSLMQKWTGGADKFAAKMKSVQSLAALASPFAEVPADTRSEDMPLIPPDLDAPKPLPFPAIVGLGNKIDNYERFMEKAQTKDVPLLDAIQRFADRPDQAPKEIESLQDTYRQMQGHGKRRNAANESKQLNLIEAAQRAWSFIAGHDIAEAVDTEDFHKALATGLRSVTVSKSGSKVTVHHPQSPFARKALASLGM